MVRDSQRQELVPNKINGGVVLNVEDGTEDGTDGGTMEKGTKGET